MPQAIPAFAGWVAGYFGAAGTIAYGVAYGIAYVGAYAAIAYGASELAKPDQSEARDPGSLLQLKADANYPREIVVGTRATGGSLVYFNLSGDKNSRLHYVIALSDHRSTSLKRVWIDGNDAQTLNLTHGQDAVITKFGTGGAAKCFVSFYDGRADQSHHIDLPGVSGGKWTPDHRLRGVSYVVVTMDYDAEKLRGPPSFIWELEGAKLYDRRLDTTAGGSGAHRLNDETTWAYSENPEVFWDHYRQGIYRDGKLWWGMGRPAGEVPYAEFAARANLCDEDVDIAAGGTQKRYRVNGVVSATETHAAIARDIAKAMGGRVIDIGGRVRVTGGAAQSPVMTLTDGDIIEGAPLVYTSRVGFDELVNRVEATYVNPDEIYAEVGIVPVENDTYLAADGGVEHTATPLFRFETDAIRCQRLATLHLEDARLQGKLRATFPLRACQLEPGDWFTMESTRLGFPAGKDFLVLSRTLNADLTVDIFAVETDASVTAWSEDDEAELSLPEAPDYELQALQVPALTVAATSLTATGVSLPAISVSWTAPTDPRVQQVLIEAVPSGGLRTSLVLDVATGGVVLDSGIVSATTYAVKARFIGPGMQSDWTSDSTVTTGSTYTVPRAGTADAATSGSALATALAGLGSTDAALDAAIAGLDTRADALETAAAAADSRLDAVESDLAAAVSDLDADIAAADARLDAAESDLALQGTAIGALETVTDGQATQISGLQALTRVGQNLMPEPSGRGTGAAASALGWAATGGDAGSGLQQANYAPFGGAAYIEGFDDYSSGGFRIHYYDFAIGEAGSYALSWEGAYVGFTGSPFGRIEALNADRSTTLAAGADAYFSAAGRKVSTVSAPSGSAWLRIIIAIPPQTVASYCNLAFWQIKLESGAVATLFSDEGQAVAARASITTVASTVTDQGSAIATLDSRLDAAETDIDGVTSTASNLSSRMAAVDGGSASAQTLAAVKAELEGDIAGEASARSAAVSSEASARASADTAAANRLDDLEATVDTPTTGLAARVTTAESAISDLDSTKAEASTVTSLSATVTSQGTALTAAQGDIDALQSDLDAAEATIVTHTADITENASAIATAEGAIATLDSRLDAAETDIDGVTSTASNLSSRMAAIDGGTASAQTLAQVKTELEGDIAGEATARSAAVSSEASARVSADNAAASRLDDLEATIDTPSTGLAARVTSAESAITDLDSSKAEASALSSLSATVTSQGSSLAAAEGDIDDLETAAAATASTLSTHTADIATAASVNATQDSAIASLDSRLDAAETDIDGVQSTASNLSSRMSAVDGGSASATSIAQLVARTNVGVNLLPYPSGLGNNAAASAISWQTGGGAAGSGLSQLNFAPYGGPILYEEWGSYSSAGFRVYYYDVPAAQGTYTLSAMGWPGGGLTAYIQIVGLNAAKDTGTGSSGSAYLTGSGRVSVTASPGSGTAFVRVQVVIPPQTVGSYVNLAFAQLKLEPGSVATVYSVDALAVQAHARVTDVEAAVTTLDSAQAAFESSATASLGSLSSSVSSQGSAITTLQGAAAYWETVVSASGGDLAAVRLRAGAGGSFLELVSTVLRLANVSNGAVIEIMRATGGEAFFSRPISSDGGGKRLTVGPGYGVSGQEVILWFGPDTIAPAAQSRSNGYLAFGTDGKLYDASKMVATISDTSVSTSQPQGTNRATGSLTVTVTGGTAPYTYKWRSLSVGGFDLTAETPTAASTFWRGDVVEGNVLFEEWECVVTDANNSFAILRCDVELFDGDWEG